MIKLYKKYLFYTFKINNQCLKDNVFLFLIFILNYFNK